MHFKVWHFRSLHIGWWPICSEIEPTTGSQHMSNLKANYLAITLIFSFISSVFGQWSPVDSGTTSNLNGAILLDSGTGFVVGDTGTILKSTDAGATWTPLTSGTSATLHGIYFLDPNEGIAVGDSGTILRTTDGGSAWQSVASGVKDNLRSVSFNGTNGICGGDSQDILYSTDSGAHGRSVRVDSWRRIPRRSDAECDHRICRRTEFDFSSVGWQNDRRRSELGFSAFYFDGNEGGANDVFFFDQNTGLVSGSVFDGRGAIARTTDAGRIGPRYSSIRR